MFLSLIEVHVCSVLNFFVFILQNVSWERLVPCHCEHEKWIRETDGCMDVKQGFLSVSKTFSMLYSWTCSPTQHTSCTKYFPCSHFLLLYFWQHVDSGSPDGDPVCTANAGPVPPSVCNPRGAADWSVLPVSHRGGWRWVRRQIREGAVCVNYSRQHAIRTPVPLCWAWRQGDVATEILQPHLPV